VNSTKYRGYNITEDNGRWCVNLGIQIGIKCFDSLDLAKAAVDERIGEIERGLGKP
jgi:hypothetical protein